MNEFCFGGIYNRHLLDKILCVPMLYCCIYCLIDVSVNEGDAIKRPELIILADKSELRAKTIDVRFMHVDRFC